MLYVIIIVAIIATETKIKNYIDENMKLGERKKILNNKIILSKYYNSGMFLNFMEDKKETVKMVSGAFLGFLLLLFSCFLPKKGHKLFKLGMSFVLGGATSNVSDRIKRGHVVDYFSVNGKSFKKLNKIVFNLSDLCIFLGSALIIFAGYGPGKSSSFTHETKE